MARERIDDLIDLGERIVERAKRAGADVAEVSVKKGAHLAVRVRKGERELVEEAGSRSVSLRVMIGQQVAVTGTSDLTESGIGRAVEDAIELAKLAEPDPFAGPPDPSLLSRRTDHANLDLLDPKMNTLDAGEAMERALAGERAAFAWDARIVNSEGASFARTSGGGALVTSGGFRGAIEGTYASIVVRPVVDDEGGKKRGGYHYSAKRYLSELEAPEKVGAEAARRTLAKLGAKKVPTQEVPVVFDPDAGRAILSLLGACASGGSIWRKSSYLVGREGTKVASELVNVIDDPFIPRGPGSRPYDGEGLLSRKNIVVENGVLKTYLLDTYSAKKLGKASTASASRGGGSPGVGTTNFIMQPGTISASELIGSTKTGLYVTDMMGYGFNAVTGDFSRGASGFWIENGERTFPVSEVTISLNLDQILQRIDAVASDLDLRSSIATPTFRVSAMMVAGA